MKKKTLRGCGGDDGDREGVSVREKRLLLAVIEKVIRRRGWEGNEEGLGRLADEIEKEANDRIEELRGEEEAKGRLEEEEEKEMDDWDELGKIAGIVSHMTLQKGEEENERSREY